MEGTDRIQNTAMKRTKDECVTTNSRRGAALPVGGYVAGIADWSMFSAAEIKRAVGARPDSHELASRAKVARYSLGRFSNVNAPGDAQGNPGAKTLAQLAMGNQKRIPKERLPVLTPSRDLWDRSRASALAITWLGHSSTIVDVDGARFLTDPVFAERVGPSPRVVGAPRFHGLAIPVDELPEVDAVIISHDHYDHLDVDTVISLGAKGARFIVPLGVGAHLRFWGIPASRVLELDWWEETLVRGVRVVATPARHFSGRGPTDRMRTLWASFAFVGPTHRVFFSGDTAYHVGFAEIGERVGPFDLVMLEVGAFHESWAHVHLGPDRALPAFRDVRGKTFLPIHWGTYPLALHDWWEPAERVVEVFGKAGAPFVTPRVGETIGPSVAMPTDAWWRPFVV